MKYLIFCACILVYVAARPETFTYDRHQENSKVNVQADFDNIMVLFGSLDDKTPKPPQQSLGSIPTLPASPFEWLLTKAGFPLPDQKKDLTKSAKDSSNEIEDRESPYRVDITQENLKKVSL